MAPVFVWDRIWSAKLIANNVEYKTPTQNGAPVPGGAKVAPQEGEVLGAVATTPGVATWKCPVCGALNTGKFCTECGAKRPEEEAKKVCPKCGNPVEDKAKFCPECGEKLQ